MNRKDLVYFLSLVLLFISSLFLFEYTHPRMIAKDKIYRRIDDTKNFKFECFWDFNADVFPSRICMYESIKKD